MGSFVEGVCSVGAAFPVYWRFRFPSYYLHAWLQQFEYRTTISWWIFVAAVVGAFSDYFARTVSYQAIRAADNPVKSLRSE